MTPRRRLLLIAYHFPPEPAAGARRPGFLAEYLGEHGWDVTVLTRPLGPSGLPCRVVTAPVLGSRTEAAVRGALGGEPAAQPSGRTLRSLLRGAKEAVLFPDRAAAWLPAAIARALALTARTPYAAVLSTAMPASVHVAGAVVARARGLAWLADYRDLWTGNPYAQWSARRKAVERRFERWLLARANAMTTISPALASELERLHEREVSVIPNGADPREWEPYAALMPQRFELVYTGTLYGGARSPALLFEAIAALRAARDPAGETLVSFYGPDNAFVDAMARRFGVEAIVRRYGVVPRAQAMQAQRHASTLAVFLSNDLSTVHELGSKVFEYAAAGRPVLAFGPQQSAMRDYLIRNDLGWFASDLSEAIDALRRAHRRYLSGDREIRPAPGTLFDARDLAGAFASRLDAITASAAAF